MADAIKKLQKFKFKIPDARQVILYGKGENPPINIKRNPMSS